MGWIRPGRADSIHGARLGVGEELSGVVPDRRNIEVSRLRHLRDSLRGVPRLDHDISERSRDGERGDRNSNTHERTKRGALQERSSQNRFSVLFRKTRGDVAESSVGSAEYMRAGRETRLSRVL